MIDYQQTQRLASRIGVPGEIIEKDYLIEIDLFYLVRDDYFKEKLIFRGGTSLKKVYFPEYRFSEDLDFLVENKEDLKEIEYKLDQLLAKISADYPFPLDKRSEHSKDRLQFFILYDIVSEIHVTKELKIDILKDNSIPGFQRKKILFGYQEFTKSSLYVKAYTLESVVSDKIGRVLDVDNEPRDIYDLWYLLKLEVDAQKIEKEFKDKYGYNIYIPNLLNEISKEEYKRNWQIRLAKQIPNLPNYEIVVKKLEELIKIKFASRNTNYITR